MSEHLAAAISGDSTLLVQGTAGTGEEAIRYGWNYARLARSTGPPGGEPGRRRDAHGQLARVEATASVGRIGTRWSPSLESLLIPELGERSGDERLTSSPRPTTAIAASMS
jgi:hypothetical protein